MLRRWTSWSTATSGRHPLLLAQRDRRARALAAPGLRRRLRAQRVQAFEVNATYTYRTRKLT
ncbi:MAG: hypothetical protein U0527_06745 [Candidatus Eisenbacteria bacterium]